MTAVWFDKYRIIQTLGQGGSSEVFLALHIRLNTYRAIKRILKKYATGQEKQEIQILQILKHPNIPIIYDLEEDDTYFYMIEEYIEGQSLKTFRLSQRTLSEDTIRDYLGQLCQVFQFLHSQNPPILYLDLKPGNIIIQEGTIKLIDFGTAVFFHPGILEKEIYGTKGYAAPEQYTSGRLDTRTDIYGVGAVLYFLYTGKSYSGKRKDLSVQLSKVICSKKMQNIMEKCLMYFPIQRYQTMAALQKELKRDTPHKENKVIGLVGTKSGVGVTHTAILLAEYAAKQKQQKVVLAEYNLHEDFTRIEEVLYDRQEDSFMWKGVQYVKNVDKKNLEKIIAENKFVVIDFGENLVGKSQELNWCTRKILIGTHALWQEDSMQQKIKIFSEENWIHLYNFDESGIGYCSLSTLPDKDTQRVLKHMIT
ncbi:MAG: serine/threonine-protein kinase [Acetivibrio sp.]